MFDILESLKNVIKINRVCIDDYVFRLHYKFTFVILLSFSILITCRQYFGDPISCIQSDYIPKDVLETYCWTHTTFTLPNAWDKKVGVEVPHPGVANDHAQDKQYHAYYQWVCFVLFIQALMFYAPRYYWKVCEGGRVERLSYKLNEPLMTETHRMENVNLLVKYLTSNKNEHLLYLVHYMIAEICNFIIVFSQMFLIDHFLGGQFMKYGRSLWEMSDVNQEVRNDTIIQVFPRMTKCTFYRYGDSGDIQKYDALCILPLNVLNEKIYIFLWFWFIILTCISAISLVYRLMVVTSQRVRYELLKYYGNHTELKQIVKDINIGDWFLLSLLSKNIEPCHYKILVDELYGECLSNTKFVNAAPTPPVPRRRLHSFYEAPNTSTGNDFTEVNTFVNGLDRHCNVDLTNTIHEATPM